MTKHEQIANVMSFLSILFGEDEVTWKTIMDFDPDYIIEKFDRYILSSKVEYPWGLHPSLRNQLFHLYVDKWKLELENE